ncbi:MULTISPECIES: 50S ribosomal protein L30 [unclassified Methanothermobacter]|uniref:50S ribosomal protein L30 n=1 Tax=unclassified Methanothermobacter TaxID=2631116 RepID=UPI0002CD1150|nr:MULTISPECIES: 50S ribosomal protein L30 [unclassified Methanothermobacter]QEF94036.1 50S ribosomal protein L30 [Methanothermobacter sp. KEPCO-1]QHN08536.1 50S ribosomal protein L30 [Methanothermobacter sp. THM-2]BAM69273.1 50S ribosomal protein L30P [Methanothermobacter sp. CaT2]
MFAVVRVRGSAGVRRDIADTMEMLRLNRINHAVLVEDTPSYLGMLQKAKDYITWGEIDQETLTAMITKRARIIGGERLTDEYIKENTEYDSVEEFAGAVFRGEVKLEDAGIKPVFRLHPPRKGYEAIKKAFNEGGSLGYRGEKINDLLKRMI